MTPIENARDVCAIMRSCGYPAESVGGRCVTALDFLIGEFEKANPPGALPAETFQGEESE